MSYPQEDDITQLPALNKPQEEEKNKAVEIEQQTLPTYRDARGKVRVIEPHVVRACHLMAVEGLGLNEAARAVDVSGPTLWHHFQNEGVRAYFTSLCQQKLELAQSQALDTQLRNLRDTDGKVRAAAAKDLMDRGELRGKGGGGGGSVRISINLGDAAKQGASIEATAERYDETK